MFDIGLPEMMVIVVITLVVVGPKELPKVIRAVSSFMARIRIIVSEFRAGMNEFVREAELAELQESIDKTREAMDDPLGLDDFIDPTNPTATDTADQSAPAPETPESNDAEEKKDA